MHIKDIIMIPMSTALPLGLVRNDLIEEVDFFSGGWGIYILYFKFYTQSSIVHIKYIVNV